MTGPSVSQFYPFLFRLLGPGQGRPLALASALRDSPFSICPRRVSRLVRELHEGVRRLHGEAAFVFCPHTVKNKTSAQGTLLVLLGGSQAVISESDLN